MWGMIVLLIHNMLYWVRWYGKNTVYHGRTVEHKKVHIEYCFSRLIKGGGKETQG